LLIEGLSWAKSYYTRDGALSREYTNIKHAARPLAKLFATIHASSLDINVFEQVQLAMVHEGLSRRVVNDRMRRIRFIIKWAAARKHIPASIQLAASGVKALRKGQHGVRECERVKPVDGASIDAVRAYLPPTLNAMISLQLLTGMRPGEVTIIRSCDIDMSGSLWVYRPYRHKTDYLGHERIITIGPRAKEILRPFLLHDLNAYIFSPRRAQDERRANTTGIHRKATRTRKRNPRKSPGLKYTTQTYGRAIRYACGKAGIEVWSPNQLRHAAATRIRRDHGIEASRIILGHRSLNVTEIYAEVDTKQIRDIVKKVG